MNIKLQSKSYILSLLFFLPLFSIAQTTKKIENKYSPIENESEESFEQKFIKRNIEISSWLDRTAEKIDLFLVGKKVSNRKNGTHFKIQNSSFSTEGKKVVNNLSINLNPRFPNLEDYLQLKFTSTDDRADSRKAVSANLNQNQTEQKYDDKSDLFKKFGSIKTTFQPRIAIDNPVKLSHSLNFETAANFKSSVLNPKFELFADADKGVGFYDAINILFTLTPIYSLTLINDGEYLDKLHSYTTNNGFSIGQAYAERISFSYNLIFTSNNRPNYHLESYLFAFGWNQNIYKNILDFQLIPQLDFQKNNGYKGAAGLTFNMNLKF